MKKLILVATAVLFALSVGAAFAADMPAGDSAIDSGNGKKPAVAFSHTKHVTDNKIDCATCHHQVDGKDVNEKCGNCHTIDAGDGPKLKDAMHGKKQPGACYDCHLKKGAEQKKKCAECHVK